MRGLIIIVANIVSPSSAMKEKGYQMVEMPFSFENIFLKILKMIFQFLYITDCVKKTYMR